jgi:hypothetical protein
MPHKKDCDTLDKKLLVAALPALGFPPKYPHKIAQAPTEALGLGISSIWNDQGIDHVTAVLRHGDSNQKNITGCLFRDAMTTLRLKLGLPGYPFDHSYKRFRLCSTPIYLHRAWEFCNQHEFRIQDNQPQILLRRVDDQYIMQAFADHGYTDKQLKKLNLCRMWAKVITLADITTGDGKHLTQDCKEENFTSTCHQSIKWPKAGQPDRTCWRLWTEAIENCFLRADDRHERLSRPLGEWTQLPPDWKWYYSVEDNKMYRHELPGSWTEWHRNQGHGPARHQGFRCTTTVLQTLPDHALPTTAKGRNIRRPTGTAPTRVAEDDSEDQWWFEIVDAPTSIQPILQGITEGTAVWVTDGSFKDKQGTAGFIVLPTINSHEGLILVNHTPGREDDIDAYRAEAAGIYGCVAFTTKLMTYHKLHQGGRTMACDCLYTNSTSLPNHIMIFYTPAEC